MTSRLHYIDALRSIAMLFGLLVHAGTLTNEPVSSAVGVISNHFRMATFFVISGFFAAMMAERRGNGPFVAARAQALLIPLVAGLVLLNPLTNWLVYVWHAGPVGFLDYLGGARPYPTAGPQSWHLHLWFLVALFVYVAAVPAVRPLLKSGAAQRALAWLAGRGALTVPAVAALAVLSEIGMRVVWRLTFEDAADGTPFAWVPRATLTYWFYFAIGMAAFLHRPLFTALHRVSVPTFAAGAAFYGVWALLPGGVPDVAATMLQIAAEETITTAAFATLLLVFRRWLDEETGWVSRLSASVYTIYVFHFLLIYLIALAVGRGIGTYPLYALAAVGSGVLGYALHVGLVARVPALGWLFNGRSRLSGQARIAKTAA